MANEIFKFQIEMESSVAEWAARCDADKSITYDVNEFDIPDQDDARVVWFFERPDSGFPTLSYNIVHQSCDHFCYPEELEYSLQALDEPEAFIQFDRDFEGFIKAIAD